MNSEDTVLHNYLDKLLNAQLELNKMTAIPNKIKQRCVKFEEHRFKALMKNRCNTKTHNTN